MEDTLLTGKYCHGKGEIKISLFMINHNPICGNINGYFAKKMFEKRVIAINFVFFFTTTRSLGYKLRHISSKISYLYWMLPEL